MLVIQRPFTLHLCGAQSLRPLPLPPPLHSRARQLRPLRGFKGPASYLFTTRNNGQNFNLVRENIRTTKKIEKFKKKKGASHLSIFYNQSPSKYLNVQENSECVKKPKETLNGLLKDSGVICDKRQWCSLNFCTGSTVLGNQSTPVSTM